MIFRPLLAAALVLCLRPCAASELDGTAAVLQGLDKITTQVTVLDVPLNTPVRFGDLDITVRACRKHPPEESPESAAFLEITETKPALPPVTLFSGWMFASSPALSALEHPIYDVSVLDCKVPANAVPVPALGK